MKDMIDYSENGIVSKMILKEDSGNVTLFAFDKTEGLSEHSAPYDAMVQIIEGKAIISIDKKEHELSEGEFIIMPSDIPHAVKPVTRFKMLLTMIKKQ